MRVDETCKECGCDLTFEELEHGREAKHGGKCCSCFDAGAGVPVDVLCSELGDAVVQARARLRLFKQRWAN